MPRRSLLLCAGLTLCSILAFDAPLVRAEDLSPAEALLKEGDVLFGQHQYETATKVYERAVAVAEKDGNASALVEALSMAARGYLIRDEKEAGRPFIERAAKLATAKQPEGWSRFLGVRGRFEWKDDHKPKAAKTFEAMYAYCLAHEQWSRAVDAAHMVAIVGTHEQQIEWGKKGIEAAGKGGMEGWLGPLWNNLGNTYDELNRPKEALAAWLKARYYHWKVGTEKRKLVADWAVGLGYRKVGELEKAIQWQRPVLAWAERRVAEKPEDAERREWVALAQAELGFIALAQGRGKAAGLYLEPAHDVLKAAGMPDWHPAYWKELEAALAKARGQRSDAHPKAEATRASLAAIASAIANYRLWKKKLPASLEVLTETDARTPHPLLEAIPKDGWGNPFEYRILDRTSYQVRSNGPDGMPNTEDDLVHLTRD